MKFIPIVLVTFLYLLSHPTLLKSSELKTANYWFKKYHYQQLWMIRNGIKKDADNNIWGQK